MKPVIHLPFILLTATIMLLALPGEPEAKRRFPAMCQLSKADAKAARKIARKVHPKVVQLSKQATCHCEPGVAACGKRRVRFAAVSLTDKASEVKLQVNVTVHLGGTASKTRRSTVAEVAAAVREQAITRAVLGGGPIECEFSLWPAGDGLLSCGGKGFLASGGNVIGRKLGVRFKLSQQMLELDLVSTPVASADPHLLASYDNALRLPGVHRFVEAHPDSWLLTSQKKTQFFVPNDAFLVAQRSDVAYHAPVSTMDDTFVGWAKVKRQAAAKLEKLGSKGWVKGRGGSIEVGPKDGPMTSYSTQ